MCRSRSSFVVSEMTAEICVSLRIGNIEINLSTKGIPLPPLRRALLARPRQRRIIAAVLLRRQQLLDRGVAIDDCRLVDGEAAGVGGRSVCRIERLAEQAQVDRELRAVMRGV